MNFYSLARRFGVIAVIGLSTGSPLSAQDAKRLSVRGFERAEAMEILEIDPETQSRVRDSPISLATFGQRWQISTYDSRWPAAAALLNGLDAKPSAEEKVKTRFGIILFDGREPVYSLFCQHPRQYRDGTGRLPCYYNGRSVTINRGSIEKLQLLLAHN